MHRPQRSNPSPESQMSDLLQIPDLFSSAQPSVSHSDQAHTSESVSEQMDGSQAKSVFFSQPAYLRKTQEAKQSSLERKKDAFEPPIPDQTASPAKEELVSSVRESPASKSKSNAFSELESAMRGQSVNELTNFRNSLARVETIIRQGKRIPVGNMVAVDSNQVLQLLEDLDKSVPGVIENARGVMEKRSELLSNAKKLSDNAIQASKDLQKQTEAMLEQRKAETIKKLQLQVDEKMQRASYEAENIIRQAHQQGQMIVDSAEQKAQRILNEQEILARANMEAEELKRQTQENIETVYTNVYQQLDTMLDVIDRSYSQQLNDIRVMRQQINQNMK